MPTRPVRTTFSNSSVDVLNAIRNSTSANYRNYVPIATPDADSIRTIGAILMDQPQLQNEFMQTLVNRIGRVIISSKMYQNPWAVFKQGKLELGETIEDIFVELASPFQYDPVYAATNVEARVVPDVRSAFYTVNYEKFYKVTTQEYDFRRAFLSMDGVTNLISKIIESMYTAANYDEYQVMKYMLFKRLVESKIPFVETDTADSLLSVASTAKGVSNEMTFMNTKYNIAGVHTFALKEDQYLIMSASTDARMDVNVLASAFNMDKAEFMGHRILIDSFTELDMERVTELLGNTPGFVSNIGTQMANAGPNIHGIIVDKDFWKVYDVIDTTLSRMNEEGLYRNSFYHVHKIFATSPFANCAVIMEHGSVADADTITGLQNFSIGVDGTAQLSAVVEAGGVTDTSVVYTSSNEAVATVTPNGYVVGVSAGTATITATSYATPSVTATCTVTVTA